MVAAALNRGTGRFGVPEAVPEWADAELRRLGLGLDLDAERLLGARARISGYFDRGRCSPGGSCRLLEARDGWIALNLARDEDWELLPALFEEEVAADWDAVADAVRTRPVGALVARGREMGLALAADEPPAARSGGRAPGRTREVPATRNPGRHPRNRAPRVVDLSSLWAGPLCGRLLRQLGAEVLKVESVHRPDGARRGAPMFFDLLNTGKTGVTLDFRSGEGRAHLAALVESADIVIEASRPRALRQLGLDAEAICARRPGLVWVGITAYGRAPGTENWIGYGDDVAVAAGLSAVVRQVTGQRRIVGDAIADPLTGIHAARLAWQAWRAGRGGLLDVSLHGVVRRCLAETGLWARPGRNQPHAARHRERRAIPSAPPRQASGGSA